jgi:hypothetical protein
VAGEKDQLTLYWKTGMAALKTPCTVGPLERGKWQKRRDPDINMKHRFLLTEKSIHQCDFRQSTHILILFFL